MKYRIFVPAVLLAVLFLLLPGAAQAEAPRQALWSWMVQLPSTWLDGLHSLWQREGATIDPFGQPGPTPEGHPAGGLDGPGLEGVGLTIDPWGQPVPGAAYDGVGATIDPFGQPVPGAVYDGVGGTIDPHGQPPASSGGPGAGDVGPYIDPLG